MHQENPQYRLRDLNLEEQARRDELYRELGKAYYEGAFEDPLPQLLPLFDELTALLQEPVEENLCPRCGAEIAQGAAFCDECGYRLIPAEPVPEPVREETRFCPECGNQLRPEAKFCGKCGTRIE